VRVKAIKGINTSIRLLILAQSSYFKAKRASLLSKALYSTIIRRRLSLYYYCNFPEEGINTLLDLLEFNKV
jgi:aminoglycoside phosphotransferase family enzyme